jgi:hypothetical protein
MTRRHYYLPQVLDIYERYMRHGRSVEAVVAEVCNGEGEACRRHVAFNPLFEILNDQRYMNGYVFI